MSKHKLVIEIECDDRADDLIKEYLDWKAESGTPGYFGFGEELDYLLKHNTTFAEDEVDLAYRAKVKASITS